MTPQNLSEAKFLKYTKLFLRIFILILRDINQWKWKNENCSLVQ